MSSEAIQIREYRVLGYSCKSQKAHCIMQRVGPQLELVQALWRDSLQGQVEIIVEGEDASLRRLARGVLRRNNGACATSQSLRSFYEVLLIGSVKVRIRIGDGRFAPLLLVQFERVQYPDRCLEAV